VEILGGSVCKFPAGGGYWLTGDLDLSRRFKLKDEVLESPTVLFQPIRRLKWTLECSFWHSFLFH